MSNNTIIPLSAVLFYFTNKLSPYLPLLALVFFIQLQWLYRLMLEFFIGELEVGACLHALNGIIDFYICVIFVF